MVAIDTHVLIWGVRKTGSAEMVERAQWLFETLEDEEAQIVVPAICVAEYLVKIPVEVHAPTLAAITDRFHIAPFDAKGSMISAALWEPLLKERGKGKASCRGCIKTDCMIVASAKAFGVHRLISNDRGCRSLAKKRGLVAMDLPETREHLWGPMFDGSEPSPRGRR